MNSNTYFRQHPRKGICGKKDVTFSETEDTLTLSVATKTETEDVVVTLTDPSTLTIQFRRKNVDIRQILEKRDAFVLQAYTKLIHAALNRYQQEEEQVTIEKIIHLPIQVETINPEITLREGVLQVSLTKINNTRG